MAHPDAGRDLRRHLSPRLLCLHADGGRNHRDGHFARLRPASFRRDRIQAKRLSPIAPLAGGATIGIIGMVLLSISEDGGSHAVSAAGSPLIGSLLGLVAGFTYALYSSCARHLMQGGISSTTAMGATFGIGGILLMPVLIATGGPFLASWNNAAVGLYMAFVPMFLGYVCFGYGLSRVETSVATTITLFEPVVAAFFAVVIVGERLSALGWFGVLLVVICLVCITMPARSRKNPLEVPEPST